MKFLKWDTDGGKDATVEVFWLAEIKPLFSVGLLKFNGASREAYHSHAFNSISWLVSGKLHESTRVSPSGPFYGLLGRTHSPSVLPIVTRRSTYHKVDSKGTSWVLTFRGPWVDRWTDHDLKTGKTSTLTHGRKEL